jgi:hypothetical protein
LNELIKFITQSRSDLMAYFMTAFVLSVDISLSS